MLVFPTAGIYCLSAGSRDIHTVALWERYELKGLKGYAGSFKAALQLSPACAFWSLHPPSETTSAGAAERAASAVPSSVDRLGMPCGERGRMVCAPALRHAALAHHVPLFYRSPARKQPHAARTPRTCTCH